MADRLMTVESIAHFPDQGTVMQGRLQTGPIRVGDKVRVRSPANTITAMVRGIERIGTRESLRSASEGDDVALLFRPIDFSQLADGVVFAEYAQIRPTELFIDQAEAERPKWWQVWK